MLRGVYTETKLSKPPENPLRFLHVPHGRIEPGYDEDEKAVWKYAKENPMCVDDVAEDVETSRKMRREPFGVARLVATDASRNCKGLATERFWL